MKPGDDDDDDDDEEEFLHKDMAHRHNHHHGGIKAEDKDEDEDEDEEEEEDDDEGISEEDMNKKQQQQESEEEEEEHKRKHKHIKHKEKFIKHSHHLDKDITHYTPCHDDHDHDHSDRNHHEYMSPGPCAACKFLRRKCVRGCVFAPYFLSEQGTEGFCAVHKVFGASNVSKLLSRIGAHEQRQHAVLTIQYEAQARLLDPVYGCVRIIFSLQHQVQRLQAELDFVRAQLSTCHHQMQQLLLANTGGFGLSTPLTTIGNNYPSCQLPQHLIEENMQQTSHYDSQCIPSFLPDAHSTIVTSSVSSSSASNIGPHLMLDNVNLSCDELNMMNTNNQDVSYKEDHALNSKASNGNNSWNSSINNYNAVAPFLQYNSNEGLTLNHNHNYLTTFDQSLDTVQRTIFTNSLQHYQDLQTSPIHQQLQGYFQ